jgi:hypothetical protein
MKKFKMIAVVFGLLLSVAGASLSASPTNNAQIKNPDCQAVTVDSDCTTAHMGVTCTFSSQQAFDIIVCEDLLKKP